MRLPPLGYFPSRTGGHRLARKSAASATDRDEVIRWLFENSRDLMHVIDAEGCFKLTNAAWKQITGWDECDLLGKGTWDLFHPDDIEVVGPRIRALNVGEVSEDPIRTRLRSGGYRWFAARTQKAADGSYIVSMRDITEERARSDELEEVRRARRLLSEAAGIGAWAFEPLENRIAWSQDLLSLTGYAPEDITTPELFYSRLHPADRKRTRRAMTHSVLTGEPGQLQHRLKVGGQWRTFRATFHTEARAEGVFALQGLSQDIAELTEARDAAKRGEQQMRKARREVQVNARRLKLALEAAEAGVYEIDHVAKTFWASPEFVRLTGQSNASYEEATRLRFPGFHADDLPHVRESFRALHAGSKTSGEGFEARIIRPDGETRWIRVSHHLKTGRNGRWLKAVGLVQDFDARKRQELALREAQQAAEAGAEAKAAFLANMSHEIRTPMNGVMGVLHLLKSESLTEEGRGMLGDALSCGQMLAELLNDVIDFSKIEAGRLELASEPVDPKALLEGVVRLLKPQADAKRLRLSVEIDKTLGWVQSDPVRLRQALFNLVGNAVKFTETGSVVVRCAAPRPGRLRFEVEDTGVGVAEDVQARIFQRFDQGDASTTRRFGGSGLGLTITRKLAEMMSGDVGLVSELGVGSTFWLEVAAEPATAQTAAADNLERVLEGLRILVVEDNPTNRMIATKLLEAMGAQVATAEDGYLGVDAAAAGGFDLILMDVQMPGIDGLEAARRIRALGGPASRTPIVALTANVLSHQRRAYLDAGMDGVVGKPISPAVLIGEIARLSQGAQGLEATVAA
ncbi:MAG: sensory box histidine kinase/response regulator [Phenylobacterium sp.]|nr:sensory box histidine kinase/response regulator [Phenylobacterium sp.]